MLRTCSDSAGAFWRLNPLWRRRSRASPASPLAVALSCPEPDPFQEYTPGPGLLFHLSSNTARNPRSAERRLFVEHDLGGSLGSAVDAARRAGYPWTEQMIRKLSRKVRETRSSNNQKRSERGQEVLAAR